MAPIVTKLKNHDVVIIETVPPGGSPIVTNCAHTELSPEVVLNPANTGAALGTRTLICFDVTDDETP